MYLGQPLPLVAGVGAGRIGIESAYVASDDPGTDFGSVSPATQHVW